MKVVTAQQIRELDRKAMEEGGIPGVVLMENAGRAVVDSLQRDYGPLIGKRIAVFCGGGNNGGDGFVILRLLALAGVVTTLFCAEETLQSGRLKPDAAVFLEVARRFGICSRAEIPDAGQLQANSHSWSHRFDIAIDALLGTGVKDAPRGWIADAVRAINALKCPVVSVDIPSGIDADTGTAAGEAVRASTTVTFAYPKLGLFLYPGYEHAGRLHISDIGFDWRTLELEAGVEALGCGPGPLTAGLTASPSLREPIGWENLLHKRRPESNKGDYGHVGILAGSRGMVGAPALVARAAQRTGAGLVTVLTAASAQPIIAGKLDEQMTLPLAECDGSISESAWEAIAAFAGKAAAFCIGPGLTTNSETVRLVHRILREIDVPIILDADGLNALALEPTVAQDRSKSLGSPLIITPHPGEAARLLGTSVAQIQSDRVGSVRELARRYAAVAVLKGRYTLIADPDGMVCINTTGNPGMATGGMGDALTGIIGALMAQETALSGKHADCHTAPLFTAALGVHLHGIAGDMAAATRGEAGLTAGDVIDHLPAAFSRLILED